MKSYFSKLIFFTIISLFILSCTNTKNTDTNNKKITAGFYIGGFTGTSYIVKIQDNILSYSSRYRGSLSKIQKRTLSSNDLNHLEKTLSELQVEQWRKRYTNSAILDGTGWLIKYNSKTLKIDSRGNNNFPDNFDELTQYISQTLLKGKTFQ